MAQQGEAFTLYVFDCHLLDFADEMLWKTLVDRYFLYLL